MLQPLIVDTKVTITAIPYIHWGLIVVVVAEEIVEEPVKLYCLHDIGRVSVVFVV